MERVEEREGVGKGGEEPLRRRDGPLVRHGGGGAAGLPGGGMTEGKPDLDGRRRTRTRRSPKRRERREAEQRERRHRLPPPERERRVPGDWVSFFFGLFSRLLQSPECGAVPTSRIK